MEELRERLNFESKEFERIYESVGFGCGYSQVTDQPNSNQVEWIRKLAELNAMIVKHNDYYIYKFILEESMFRFAEKIYNLMFAHRLQSRRGNHKQNWIKCNLFPRTEIRRMKDEYRRNELNEEIKEEVEVEYIE